MATTSTLSSISLPTTTSRTESAIVPSTTASFTLTLSESTTPGSASSSRNDSSTLGASSSSPASNVPSTTGSAPTSVLTVEVSSSGDNNNNNNGQSYPIGLILGIVTGFSILILVMGIMFLILWKNRQHGGTRRGDEASELLSSRKRKKGFMTLAGRAESHPLRKGSVDSTRSEDAEAPLPPISPPPPSRRRVSKQPPGDDDTGDRERGERYDAHTRCWPTTVGTSMVPVQSPRDCAAAAAAAASGGDRHTGEEGRSYLPFRSHDTTLVRSPPSAVPMMSPYRPPPSHRNHTLAPFSAPLPPGTVAPLQLSQRRRLSYPDVSAGIDPLGMNPPPLRIITPGSAAYPPHHHFRSRSSSDIANAAAAGATVKIKPPPKHYQRPFSRGRYDPNHHRIHNNQHQSNSKECHNTGIVGSYAPAAPITKTPSEPSPTTDTHSRSRGHHPQLSEPDSMSSPHSQSRSGDDAHGQQLDFFELSPPPRRRGSSSWPARSEGGEDDNNKKDKNGGGGVGSNDALRLGLPVEGGQGGLEGDRDRAGKIDRGSGLRISGVDQLAGGPAPLARRYGEDNISEEAQGVDSGNGEVGRGEERHDETFLHA